jgi:hypothetical protein
MLLFAAPSAAQLAALSRWMLDLDGSVESAFNDIIVQANGVALQCDGAANALHSVSDIPSLTKALQSLNTQHLLPKLGPERVADINRFILKLNVGLGLWYVRVTHKYSSAELVVAPMHHSDIVSVGSWV